MMNLEQYKETIHKCSKCGLCQECCPAYRTNGNECETARGFLIMLRGILTKELPLKKGINKYLDLCLRCGLCSACCPSEIPVEDIIFAVKRKYLYTTFWGLITRIKQSATFEKWFSKKHKLNSKSFSTKAVYLGCNSSEALEILNKNNIEVLNKNELSWGLSYILSGNIIRFRKNFIDMIQHLISTKPDFVVTDIPTEQFRTIIKTYINRDFNIPIKYIGEFENSNTIVCKYYNPEYAKQLLEQN